MSGLLGDALAYLDARKRFAGKQLGEFASDPIGLLGQWGTQIGQDATQGAQGMLDASKGMQQGDPQAQDKMMTGLLGVGPLSVHQFRTPKGAPPTYQVAETTGHIPDLAGLTPDQRLMWEMFLQKQAQQAKVLPFPQ